MTNQRNPSTTIVPLNPRDATALPNITIVPFEMTKRHRTTVIVTPPGSDTVEDAPPAIDVPLLQTLGKAFYWKRLIDSGAVASSVELAEQLGLKYAWVCEVLRMTLLAPDIVQAVVDGKQPRQLNLHALRGRDIELSRSWCEQRAAFGCARATKPIDGPQQRA